MSILDVEATAEVETLGVVSIAQGRGLGAALLRAALHGAAAVGYTRATLSVAAANERACALYRRAGFALTDVRVCWERQTRTGRP